MLSRSVHDEITRVRIERGRELLSATEMTLPQIAQATGFCHQAYFGAVFKSQTGMTPSQFRQENAQREQSAQYPAHPEILLHDPSTRVARLSGDRRE